MQATADPSPFPAAAGYTITVTGGVPPYDFTAAPSPPNPPGVQITVDGNVATVTVPPDTPSGTTVRVAITDSASGGTTSLNSVA